MVTIAKIKAHWLLSMPYKPMVLYIGTAKNAGLSNGPKYNDQVSVNGKSIPNVVVDQKISQVCNAARVKVPYNCQNGECGTCTVKMNGKKVRACVSKVPAGKCAIQTL